MITREISLSEAESDLLRSIAERTGKTQEELIREGIELVLAREAREYRLALLRRGRGIWKDRADLPPLDELRAESNRHGK